DVTSRRKRSAVTHRRVERCGGSLSNRGTRGSAAAERAAALSPLWRAAPVCTPRRQFARLPTGLTRPTPSANAPFGFSLFGDPTRTLRRRTRDVPPAEPRATPPTVVISPSGAPYRL